MKFAICNELFEGWPLPEVFAYAAGLGYDGVEVAHFTLCDSVTEVTPAERQRLRSAAERVGIAVTGLHWVLKTPTGLHITHPDAAVRGRTAEYFHELIDFCADLGGQKIVIGSPKSRNVVPPLTPEQAFEHARALFAGCCDHAAERDVLLCIEPLGANQTDFINLPEDGLRMVEAVGHPAFKLILDVYSMHCGAVDIPAAIAACAPHLAHFHANDDNLSYPGTGGVDYRPIFDALQGIGYQGFASVEVFEFAPDPRTIASEALAFLRRGWQVAGL